MIDQESATALLELPHLTPTERIYLEDVRDDRLGQWTGRLPLGLQGQMEYVLEQLTYPLACPNCQAPTPEIAARTVDNARDDDHRCPNCLRPLSYHISMIGGEQLWTVQPLRADTEHVHG